MSTGDEDSTPASEGDEPAEDELESVPFEDLLESATEAIEGIELAEAEPADIEAAVAEIAEALPAADTEAELDEVEALLETAESRIADAAFPAPEDEDEEDPAAELEEQLGDLEDDLAAARGPYAEDVTETIEAAVQEVSETRWTADGREAVIAAVEAFVATVTDTLDAADIGAPDDADAVPDVLEESVDAIEAAGLDPDADADTIQALVDAADTLSADVAAAEAWSDLSTREQLKAEGFFTVLDHHKDYPPEWSALKEHEKRGNVEMVLLALDKLGSDFYEEHCLDALRRMGHEGAIEPMLERASRRDQPAIEILGKIGSDEVLDTLLEYVEPDADAQLQRTTLKALGEIGSSDATQAVANRLEADDESIRSHAARALGMIGDPRAIEPLADVLANDDADTVRPSAAWALNQIGTEAALAAVSDYQDDRAYLVQSEADKAASALG